MVQTQEQGLIRLKYLLSRLSVYDVQAASEWWAAAPALLNQVRFACMRSTKSHKLLKLSLSWSPIQYFYERRA
jgi:hypothetical protein